MANAEEVAAHITRFSGWRLTSGESATVGSGYSAAVYTPTGPRAATFTLVDVEDCEALSYQSSDSLDRLTWKLTPGLPLMTLTLEIQYSYGRGVGNAVRELVSMRAERRGVVDALAGIGAALAQPDVITTPVRTNRCRFCAAQCVPGSDLCQACAYAAE